MSKQQDDYKDLPDSAPIPTEFQAFFNSIGNGAKVAKPEQKPAAKPKSEKKGK